MKLVFWCYCHFSSAFVDFVELSSDNWLCVYQATSLQWPMTKWHVLIVKSSYSQRVDTDKELIGAETVDFSMIQSNDALCRSSCGKKNWFGANWLSEIDLKPSEFDVRPSELKGCKNARRCFEIWCANNGHLNTWTKCSSIRKTISLCNECP